MIPQQNNETPVGLAGLQKSGVAVPSQTRNMEYFFNLAKKMSDGQLADVLSGKSLNVPQFVAMTEAMGRKQLRQAMQGAQAQQQAQQPSVKDQLLAETAAGIDQLPAPNMASLGEGHAAGGIIAFNGENGSHVPTQEEIDEYIKNNPALQRSHAVTNPGKAIAEWWSNLPSQQDIWETGKKARTGQIPGFYGEDLTPKGKLVQAGLVDPETPRRDVLAVAQKNLDKKNLDLQSLADFDAATALFEAERANKGKLTGGDGKPPSASGGGGQPPSTGFGFNPRVSRMEGLKTEAVDYNKIKEQGFGEGLLRLAGGILSKPGAAGYGAGMTALAEQAGLTRKEIAGLKKDQREYDFLMAKAQDAFDHGNDKLALDIKKQADDHLYHMAHVAALGANNPLALVAAVKKDPSILDTLSQISGAKSDPRTNQILIGKHADYMKSAQGVLNPMSFEQWLTANGYNLGGQQVASSGNQGYSAVYDASGKRIQ